MWTSIYFCAVTMRRYLVVFVLWSVVETILAGEQDPQGIIKTFKTNNGFGVASVAGVTSRNGRVSAISGVNYFPSGSNPFYFPMTKSGEKIPEPISFSKQEDGKFTAGQIKYGPGSVSVTSIARSVFPEDSTKTVNPKMPIERMFKTQFKPDDMLFMDPFASFNSRSLNPWFPNTFMFRQPTFQNINSIRPMWPYTNINPLFNFWRR